MNQHEFKQHIASLERRISEEDILGLCWKVARTLGTEIPVYESSKNNLQTHSFTDPGSSTAFTVTYSRQDIQVLAGGKEVCFHAKRTDLPSDLPHVKHGDVEYEVVKYSPSNISKSCDSWNGLLAMYAGVTEDGGLMELWRAAPQMRNEKLVEKLYNLALHHGKCTKRDVSSGTTDVMHEYTEGQYKVILEHQGNDDLTVLVGDKPVLKVESRDGSEHRRYPLVDETHGTFKFRLVSYVPGRWRDDLLRLEQNLSTPISAEQEERAKALGLVL